MTTPIQANLSSNVQALLEQDSLEIQQDQATSLSSQQQEQVNQAQSQQKSLGDQFKDILKSCFSIFLSSLFGQWISAALSVLKVAQPFLGKILGDTVTVAAQGTTSMPSHADLIVDEEGYEKNVG